LKLMWLQRAAAKLIAAYRADAGATTAVGGGARVLSGKAAAQGLGSRVAIFLSMQEPYLTLRCREDLLGTTAFCGHQAEQIQGRVHPSRWPFAATSHECPFERASPSRGQAMGPLQLPNALVAPHK
jgi:hypothetical protein